MTAVPDGRPARCAGAVVGVAFTTLLAVGALLVVLPLVAPVGAGIVPSGPATKAEIYQPHTLTLTLKNFLRVTRDRLGEFKYLSISTPVLAVHPHIVLGLAGLGSYADDGFDLAGNNYHLYLVFTQHRLASLVTLAPDLKPAPLQWLSLDQKEILRASIREVAQSGCRRTLPETASTAELARFDLGPCIKQLFAAR